MKLALFWADGDEIPQALGVHTTIIGSCPFVLALRSRLVPILFFFDMIHDIWS